MAAYTTIDDPEAYFQVKAYTGDGAATLALTLDGDTDMQPDLVWIKNRSSGENHAVVDAVRGVGLQLLTNSTAAEYSNANSVKAFNSDGFSVGDLSDTNGSGNNLVAWCWKESATAGFDIVNNVKNDTDVENVSHNLSAVPHWIIGKSRTGGSYRWICYHKDVGNDDAMYLNENFAETDSDTFWNDTTPTSSVFTLGADNSWNGTNIFYVWTPIQGFSSMGSYTGNGNADGRFIWTNGMKPAWLLHKNINGANGWSITDNKRETFNVMGDLNLYPESAGAESGNSNYHHDFLSNGFKIRSADDQINKSGDVYIYIAFAEAPFVNSKGVPCNAR